MAVSITPNLDITQAFTPNPAVDRSNSPSGNSNSIPQWNGTQASDLANDSSSSFADSFLDVLGTAQALATQVTPIATPSVTATMQSVVGTANQFVPVTTANTVQTAPVVGLPNSAGKTGASVAPAITAPSKSTQTLLATLLSVPSTQSGKPEKDPKQTNVSEAQQPLEPFNAVQPPVGQTPAVVPAPVIPGSSTPLPVLPGDNAASKSATVGQAKTVAPVQTPNAAISATTTAPAVTATNESSAQSDGPETLAFQGQLIASNVKPSVEPQANISKRAVPNDTVDVADDSGKPSGSSASTNTATSKVQQTASIAPAASAPDPNTGQTGSGSAHSGNDQPAEQGAKEVKPNEAPKNVSEPSANAAQAFASVNSHGNQNNPAKTDADSSSSNSINPPIAHQLPGDQANVKTDMNLKVQGQSGENVIVRLTERAGDIQVTVRSTDPTTSAMLRHELPSIQAGLEHSGWQLESTQAQNSSNHSGSGDSQGGEQQRNNQGPGYQGEQKKRNTQQNQWFDLMQ